MLPFLKKKSEAAAAPLVPPWHPNFRNYEKLPDIKVVRTAFFVNVGGISVALALLIFCGFKEWQLHVLRVQIAERQAQIDRDKGASDQAVILFKKFQAEEAKIAEVDAFVKSKPNLSEIITHLSETLPPNIALDSIDLRENGLVIRFSVKGTAEGATGHATAYRDQLAADKGFAVRFDDVQFTSTPTKNPTTGRINVEFFMHLKGAKK